jgi:hypothetical protein
MRRTYLLSGGRHGSSEAAPQPERRRILADQHGREIEPADGEDGPEVGEDPTHPALGYLRPGSRVGQ